MKSIDTNILLYAASADCPEHERAYLFVRTALERAHEWLIVDQVYFELYRLLRNPAVMSSPLGAAEASGLISWYRNKSGFGRLSYSPDCMEPILGEIGKADFPSRMTFDTVLAHTLKLGGVGEWYTRNIKGFAPYSWLSVSDPLAE